MGKLLATVRDRALERPWLLATPLLGSLAQNVSILADGGSVPLRIVILAVLVSGVTALFAELWLGDGRSLDPVRLAETLQLYLYPYGLTMVFGLTGALLVSAAMRADLPPAAANAVLYTVLALGKLFALALGAASSLAAVRRLEAPAGKWASLRLGFRTVALNAGFFLPALAGVWLFQEACVYLARSLFPGPLSGVLTTAVPLLGAVALPIEAWRAGRLKA